MSPAVPQTKSSKPALHNKLPKLPPHSKIKKRSLLRPPIPSPNPSQSQQKVIYISPSTPFMSAVHRTQSLLQQAQKRVTQSLLDHSRRRAGGGRDVSGGDAILDAAMRATGQDERKEGGKEIVWIKGTGRAVEKVLGLAEWFKRRESGGRFGVVLRTGSVWAVDDVVRSGEGEGDGEDTRVRQVSCLEVGVWLR